MKSLCFTFYFVILLQTIEATVRCGRSLCSGVGARCCFGPGNDCCYPLWTYWWFWASIALTGLVVSLCVCCCRSLCFGKRDQNVNTYVVPPSYAQAQPIQPSAPVYGTLPAGQTNYGFMPPSAPPQPPSYRDKPPEYLTTTGPPAPAPGQQQQQQIQQQAQY